MHIRPIFQQLLKRLDEPRKFIQVLLGPRHVGKTTLALQASESMGKPFHYISADLVSLRDITWLHQQWEIARQKVGSKMGGLLILDEVQKIAGWSEVIKFLWDQDTRNHIDLSVVIVGSSPWLGQNEMSESLAGRFEVLPVTHWSFTEMRQAFEWPLDRYLYFGGYPGAAALANEEDSSRWTNYINDSLIEMAISRDILLMTQVNKQALLRRLFHLGCTYSGQIHSFTKILVQLQDAGNTTTLEHYLDLLSGVGLLNAMQKFAQQPWRQRGSSPKFSVFNTALMTSQSAKTYKQAKADHPFWERLVESAIGAHLLNSIRGTQIELFYWGEGAKEVDFVLRYGDMLTAIEVQSNRESIKQSGMDLFSSKFKPSRTLLIGKSGISLEQFLMSPLADFL